MEFYKKIFKNKIEIAGAGGKKGAKPAYLMPPDGTFTKVGFQLYEALDLISEGPILGLVDPRGKLLNAAKDISLEKCISDGTSDEVSLEVGSFTSDTSGNEISIWSPFERQESGAEITVSFTCTRLQGDHTFSLVNNQISDPNLYDQAHGGSPQNIVLGENEFTFTLTSFALAVRFKSPLAAGDYSLDVENIVISDGSTALRAKKDFASSDNELGSSSNGIDKGIYFDEIPLRDSRNSPNLAKYDVSLRLGEEFQAAPLVGSTPERLVQIRTPIKGKYSMGSTIIEGLSINRLTGEHIEDLEQFEEGTSASLITLLLVSLFNKNRSDTNYEIKISCDSSILKNLDQSLGLSVILDLNDTDNRLHDREFVITNIRPTSDEPDNNEIEITARGKAKGRKKDNISIGNGLSSIGQITVTEATSDSGSRSGTGSKDIRFEGMKNGRDFVNWQNFVPRERDAKPYFYTNYNQNVKKLDVNLQIDGLQDTKSFSTASENEKGKSKMGTPLPLSITFAIKVGKVDKNGATTEEFATFTTRAGKAVSLGEGNGQITVSGIVTSPYTITLENISLPNLTDDDLYNFIEISKLEYETISNLVKRDGGVHSIIEKVEEIFLYPNSATVSTSIDSRYYSDIPTRTFRVKGKKVLIPSNYTPTEENGVDRRFSDDGSTRGNLIYSGQWDGTFKFGWTDNPAWIYYDLLINTRYGIGAKLRDTDIVDKWSLYEIGMYCDAVTMNDGSNLTNVSGAGVFLGLDDGFNGLEPRFSCNLHIQDQRDAIEVLQELSSSFRAMTYYNNSSVGVRVDRPHFFEDFNRTTGFEASLTDTFPESDEFVPPKELKFPPHLMFNNVSVKDGNFVYADTDSTQKLSAIEISYLDKRSNFSAKTEYVEDPEAVKKVGLNLKQVPGIGITSRAQANRMAKYLLFESANTTETVAFNVGFEGLLLQPGDIIQVDDEMRNFSKNFGTILKTSGETFYFDPDSTGQGLENIQSGLGPKSIIVEPSIDSDQLDLINGGNIHVYNGIGRSGIDEFYKNPTSQNELYQKIHDPQMISLKIVEGGSGLSYDVLDEGVQIHIDSVGTFSGTDSSSDTNAPSQWFSERPANIVPGSRYSIDISGRNPKYYKVINIKENPDFGYDVLGLIHHTGKFKFIEENVVFDLDSDTFQPDLTLTEITKPNEPSSVTTGAFSSNLDGSLNLPITITHAATLPGERFVVFLEEPNANQIISQFDKSTSGSTTVTLSGQAKIDQIGEYQINVFSENITPILARSNNAATTGFTTQPSDFGLNTSTDSFLEYRDISILSDFNTGSGYDNVAETGFAQISFIENDPTINATFNMAFEDVFGNSGNSVLQSVSGQVVNLYDTENNLKSGNFRTLTNETSFTVTNEEINQAFGYTGDARYQVPTGFKFQGNSFTLSGSGDLGTDGQFIQFETDTGFYDEPPMVFIQQIVDGSFEDENGVVTKQKQIGRVRTTRSGFFVTGIAADQNDYVYFASPTGVFEFDNETKVIQVGKFNKNETASFMNVNFSEAFSSTPRIITQLQQRDAATESLFSTTNITGSSTSGFDINAFDENGNAFDGSGIFGYIATDTDSFNILLSSTFPFNSLNIASSGASDINTTGDAILQEYNGASYRYNNNNQMLFAQKTGTDYTGQFIAIHRTGDENKAIAYLMDTGDNESGIRFRNPDGATNHIKLEKASPGTSYNVTGYNQVGAPALEEISFTEFRSIDDASTQFIYPLLNTNTPANTEIKVSFDCVGITGSVRYDIRRAGLATATTDSLPDVSLGANSFTFTRNSSSDGDRLLFNGYTTASAIHIQNLQILEPVTPQYTGDISLVAWARFSEDLTGKQYLMEYSNGGTGIAWFQSGNGENYVNINGTDFKAISTNLNDGNVHMLQIVIDRDVAMSGYIDGSVDDTNDSITGADFSGNLYPEKTQIKLLGNSTLTGDSLTQGHVFNYAAFITGELITGNYTSDPNSFFTGYTGDSNTDFIVAFSGSNYPTFTDASTNYTTVQVTGEIEKSDFIIDRSSLYDFDFIQIGNTGIT